MLSMGSIIKVGSYVFLLPSLCCLYCPVCFCLWLLGLSESLSQSQQLYQSCLPWCVSGGLVPEAAPAKFKIGPFPVSSGTQLESSRWFLGWKQTLYPALWEIEVGYSLFSFVVVVKFWLWAPKYTTKILNTIHILLSTVLSWLFCLFFFPLLSFICLSKINLSPLGC